MQRYLLRHAMRKLGLALGLIALAFCLGCGSGNSGSGGFTPMGNFSNTSLSGQYTYQLVGLDTIAAFREAGSFTADGNGNITVGEDDFAQGSNLFFDTSSGTYSVSNDGTGSATLNFSGGGFIQFALTLVSSSKVYMIVTAATNVQVSTLATGAGIAEKQNSGAFSSAPSGTFAFRNHTMSTSQGSTGYVGAFTVTSGAISGNEDLNRGGVQSSSPVGGLFNTPDTQGRGTGTMTDNNGTSTFAYYVVDANNVRLFSTDALLSDTIGLGRAEKQTHSSFSLASLSGNYAFGSQGDTLTNTGGVRTVGRFTSDGNGNISAGADDSVQDGIVSSAPVTFTGTYTLAASGKATVTLSPSSGGMVHEVFWMVSPSRAFFLVNDANKIEDGTVDMQQSTAFSNATMTGQFGFLMDGYVFNVNTFDRVATLQWNGSGGLTLNEAVNVGGTLNVPGPLTGTYSVSSDGRTTSTINSLSNNLVFYLVSGNDAYILQADTGAEIDGVVSKQQ